MMSSEQAVLFHLVRLALGTGSNAIPPSSIDWRNVLDMASQQGITAIVGDGIEAAYRIGLDDTCVASLNIPENEEFRYELMGGVLNAELQHEQQLQAARKLDALAEEVGMKILVFKGLSLSQYYPNPRHRECCDIDVLALENRWEELDKLILANGGTEVHDSEKHSQLRLDGVSIENHRSFTWEFSSSQKKAVNAFLNKSMVGLQTLNGYKCLYRPNSAFDEVFILEHAANHFRAKGISLRHVLDWMFVAKTADANIHWDEIRAFGLERFARVLGTLANRCFAAGIDEKYCSSNKSECDRVLEDILCPVRLKEKKEEGANRFIQKANRFFSRRWTYPITGQRFIVYVWRSLVAHILDPKEILK